MRLAEKFFSVFDAQNAFAEHDCTISPTLRSHSLARRVGCVNVILPAKKTFQKCSIGSKVSNFSPDRRRSEQSNQNQSNDDDGMGRWHFKNVFEEESVQFGHLPKDDELTNG